MKKMLVAFASFALALVAQGDVINAFDFVGFAGNEATGNSTTDHANMQTAVIRRGAGVGAATNADRFNANHWTETSLANAITADDYFEWTVTADSGFQFSITDIVFNFQRSSTGGQDWALRSSNDGYTADLITYTALGNSTGNSIPLGGSGLNNLSSVTFRFYGYNGTGTAGSAGFEGAGDDLVINGTVSAAIPEPGTLAMLGAGLAALFVARKRRK